MIGVGEEVVSMLVSEMSLLGKRLAATSSISLVMMA